MSGRIEGCPGTRYTEARSTDGSTGLSITSLIRCAILPTLRASPATITVPSGVESDIIVYIGSAHAISGASVTPNFKDKIECIKLVCAQESITHTS